MADLNLQNAHGAPITDWRAWERPKKAEEHWKAERSAMELARAWFTARTPQVPAEIEALLNTHELTSGIEFVEGQPEFVTPLPERGEGRNHDLLLRGLIGEQRVTIGLEGKADEPFGNETIGQYFQRASTQTKPTRAPQRIQALLEITFGAEVKPDQLPWSALKYQLLTGVAGTALQAARDGASLGIFLIQEFHTHAVQAQNVAQNREDYEGFVRVLCGVSEVHTGQMYGPVSVHCENKDITLLTGKAVYSWQNPSSL